MVTCYLRYIIDPDKVAEFEAYARMWMPLVQRFGGTHHGYFLPHEGANNVAMALFSFPSLAEYERHASSSADDDACRRAYAFAQQTRCIVSYERSFLRPLPASPPTTEGDAG